MASVITLYLTKNGRDDEHTITDFFLSFEGHQHDVQCSLTAQAVNLKCTVHIVLSLSNKSLQIPFSW